MDLLTDWRAMESAHEERAHRLSAGRRLRSGRGPADPVEDFLWDYYAVKPRMLARWHPGIGIVLADDGALGWRATARWAARVEGRLTLDVTAYLADRGPAVAWMHALLSAVAGREGRFALDMAASPYDCRGLGLEPVAVETAEGRAAYVGAQRAFAEQAAAVRGRLLGVTSALLRPWPG